MILPSKKRAPPQLLPIKHFPLIPFMKRTRRSFSFRTILQLISSAWMRFTKMVDVDVEATGHSQTLKASRESARDTQRPGQHPSSESNSNPYKRSQQKERKGQQINSNLDLLHKITKKLVAARWWRSRARENVWRDCRFTELRFRLYRLKYGLKITCKSFSTRCINA